MLENIISLSLIGLASSLVVCVFSTSVFCLDKSYKTVDMLNIAKQELCNIQYLVDNYNEELKEETIEKNIKNFFIKSKISKKEGYLNCYSVDIRVNYKDKKIKLESYVVKN